MSSENFNFFLPLSKIDKEKRTVSGYASTPAIDMDGEVVTLDAVKNALPSYWQWRNIRRMHSNDAVGVAKEASIDEKGLFLTAKIVDEDAWQKCQEGVYKGFSIGGRKLEKSGKTITKIDLVEISVVDRPANPECKFDVNKSAKDDGAAFLLPVTKKKTQVQAEALSKMSQVVDMLAQESDEELEQAIEVPIIQKSLAPVEEIRREVEEERKAKKLAKKARKLEKLKTIAELAKSISEPTASTPPFLTLDVDSGAEAAGGRIESSHVLDLEPGTPLGLQEGILATGLKKQDRKLLKSMGIAGSLSYCFDQIRSAQRSLIREGKREGGDQKDSTLAKRLGIIASDLAAVIGQKAIHEGAEALDLSDADDQGLLSILGESGFQMSETVKDNPDALTKMVMEILAKNSGEANPQVILKTVKENMKRVKEMRREAADCVKGAFEAHKTAYLAKQALVKAGKVKEDEIEKGFDHAGVMKMLQKAYGALTTQKTFTKAAGENLAKAAGRISAGGTGVEDAISGVYEVPAGVKTLSPDEMANLPAHKGAKSGMITAEHAEALVRAATAEAESKLLKAMPVGPQNGRKPYSFDLSKLGITAGQGEAVDPSTAALFKGANVADLTSDDQATRESALAKAIGNRIMTPGGGKTVFDPAFHGTAGGTA